MLRCLAAIGSALRFTILDCHYRLRITLAKVLTLALAGRLLLLAITFGASNWSTGHRAEQQQEAQNWSGAAYISVSPAAALALQQLAEDRNAALVEVYAIEYRLPGRYLGIWRSDGYPPVNRYADRTSLQWVEAQRSECSTTNDDPSIAPAERDQRLEIYCPIAHPDLALPAGFISIQFKGRKPNHIEIESIQDQLFDIGRLIARHQSR